MRVMFEINPKLGGIINVKTWVILLGILNNLDNNFLFGVYFLIWSGVHRASQNQKEVQTHFVGLL